VIAMLIANAVGALPDPGRSSTPLLEPAASVGAPSGVKARVPTPSHAAPPRSRRATPPAPAKAKRPAPAKAKPPAPAKAKRPTPAKTKPRAPAKAKPPAPAKAKHPPPAKTTVVRQQLEWAPVQAADSYEVALYRGATRVFSERTRRPSIEISVARSPAEASGHRTVSPGTYTWYVWPWRGGHRFGKAVVASKLVLTATGA
jgi:hypothetical protein